MLSEDTVKFLAALKDNNSRDWFTANKSWYEMAMKRPAADFAEAMCETLKTETGRAFKAKIFRINRDIRFSKDKTPYNTHLHMSFIPADGAGDGPAWMIGLEPGSLVMGVGLFSFSAKGLDAWRAAIDGAKGTEFAETVSGLQAAGARVEEPELKRVPSPFAQDHARGDLLRRKGFAIWTDAAGEAEAYGDAGPENCWKHLKKFQFVFDWLAAL